MGAIPIDDEPASFDYGRPIELSSATNHAVIYRVQAHSITTQPFAEFIAAQQTEAHKTCVRRCSQAANGMVYPQVLLGLDYWYGRGTPTNRELALHWLGKAAEAGAPEAKDFLRTNSPPLTNSSIVPSGIPILRERSGLIASNITSNITSTDVGFIAPESST